MKKSLDTQNPSPITDYEEYLESIVDTMREALIILNKDLIVISANKTFYEHFEVNPDETENITLYDLGNGQWNIPELKKLLEEILPTHNPFNNFKVEHVFPKIGKKVMLLNARQIKAKGKWKNRILIAIEDITKYDKDRLEKEDIVKREHKAMEELKQSEDRFKALIEKSNVTVAVTSTEGKILYVSPSVKYLLGFSQKDIIKNTGIDFIHPEDIENVLSSYNDIANRPGSSVELVFRHLHKKGHYVWLDTVITNLVNNPGVGGFVYNFRDITDSKKAEEVRKMSAQQVKELNNKLNDKINELETLFEMVPVGIAISEDPLGKNIQVNKQFRDILKLDPGQNASKTSDNGNNIGYKVYRNGQEVPGEELPMQKAGITKQPVINELLDIIHSDGSQKNIISSAIPILDENKNVRIVVGAFLDITERRNLEKQKDEFLGIASHELKTPITSIKAYTQVMQQLFQQQGDEKSVNLLKKMDNQINKLHLLIEDLLDVTKIESGKLLFNEEFFEFNELVNEIVEEVQRTSQRHKIIKILGDNKTVYGDRDRTGQVITNLLTNAIKYSPKSEEVIVTTQVDGNDVILLVQDYGIGIPVENQSQIFERFYRAKSDNSNTYAGLGLGLYIAKEIIRRQKGDIWFTSVVGKGSTFGFCLPTHKRKIDKNIPAIVNNGRING